MNVTDIIGDIIGGIFLFCLLHFPMKMMIASELKVNPHKKDGFIFRLNAIKVPIILLCGFIGLTYAILLAGYFLEPNPTDITTKVLHEVDWRVAVVLLIALPVIIYHLFSYKRKD